MVLIFFAFQPAEYLVREGKHFELTGETVSILINTYDNLERFISIIYVTRQGGPCMSEQARNSGKSSLKAIFCAILL